MFAQKYFKKFKGNVEVFAHEYFDILKEMWKFLHRNTLTFCANWEQIWLSIFVKSEKIHFQGVELVLDFNDGHFFTMMGW